MIVDTGHWVTDLETDFDVIPYGFIYLITCNINQKSYIGKKQCLFTLKRKPLKGKTRKRYEIKETDWKSYTSSSREVNEDIAQYGMDNFTFKIVKWCNSKAELAYYEIKMQLECDALLSDSYYNGIINCRLRRFKTIL